jgi:hypothetical protein
MSTKVGKLQLIHKNDKRNKKCIILESNWEWTNGQLMFVSHLMNNKG